MNNQTVCELRDLAKVQGLCDYYRLRKTDLIALLSEQLFQDMPLEQSTQEMPISPKKS